MKRRIASAFIALLLVVGIVSVSATPAAADFPRKIAFHGRIYIDGDKTKPVAGAKVKVYCAGKLIGTSQPTIGDGIYGFWPTVDECPIGSYVILCVDLGDGRSGSVAVMANDDNDFDINITKGYVCPEFGLIGVVIAAGAAIGIIAYMRRRGDKIKFQS